MTSNLPAWAEQATARPFLLASASPRRQSLLRDAGYRFEVHPAEIDEHVAAGLSPGDTAMFLAMAKADAVAAQFPDEVVLAADTVVALGEQILGKAAGPEQARTMLSLLAGTTHLVITGVAVRRWHDGVLKTARVYSAVRMKPLSAQQIDDYIATGQWEGKAGAYGIQDPDPFVSRLSGCQSNIVGLPMKTTARLLEGFGIRPEPGV